MKQLISIVTLFWYGACAYLALSYSQGVLVNAWPRAYTFLNWAIFAKAVLGLLLLVAFFVLIHLAVRASVLYQRPPVLEPLGPTSAGAFPSETTLVVGIWLLVLIAFLSIGLFFILNSFCWPDWIKRCLETAPDITNALSTMFGAGVGSAISTILGYLEHASEKKDFDRAYSPWYVGRPLMGMLLGLVFYFLLRGGLLAVIPNKAEPEDLSVAGLAGVGALVGLFSKEAIEKLRELFNTLFSTKKEAEQSVLNRLPPDLKKQVLPFISGSGGTGTTDQKNQT